MGLTQLFLLVSVGILGTRSVPVDGTEKPIMDHGGLEDFGQLTVGLHFTASQSGDKTLFITSAVSDLSAKTFNNAISRYKIDGNAVWDFYDSVNFRGEPLFSARGPVDWTWVPSQYNDKVSSVRPRQDWTPVTDGQLIVLLTHMSDNSTAFRIQTKEASALGPRDRIAIDFLSKGLQNLGGIVIGPTGLHLRLICSAEKVIRDHYREGVIKSGIWSFQLANKVLTVRYNGTDFYMFNDDDCLNEEIKAVEFEEEINGASNLYDGDIIERECPPGYTVTEHGACLRCSAGYFSASGDAVECTACPDNKYSYPGSDSADDCKDIVFFSDLEFKRSTTKNLVTTIYDAYWQLEKDVSVVFEVEQLPSSDCDIMMFFEQVNLQIDVEISTLHDREIRRSITAIYDEEEISITVKDKSKYNISINFLEEFIDIDVTWDRQAKPKQINFERQDGDLASGSNKIHVGVSNSSCLNFLEDQSTIGFVELQPPTEPSTNGTEETEETDETERLSSVLLCESVYYSDCETVKLTLNESLSNLTVLSLQILNIPTGRGINVTANNGKTYSVTDRLIDTDLQDGVSQLGLHLEAEGGTSIVALKYIVYEKPEYQEIEVNRIAVERAPPNVTESKGEPEESEFVRNYKIEEEENEEIKALITENLIQFVDDDDDKEEKEGEEEVEEIKVVKLDFKNTTVPMKVFSEKAESYKKENDSVASNNLMGYLAYNGFFDVGINQKNKKQKAKKKAAQMQEAISEESVSRDPVVDEEAMVETIKAFQKFNGFPESGKLTEQESKVLTLPRCGNRDTSYKDQIDAFTCIEANKTIVSDHMPREDCALDVDSFLDICSHFPNEFVESSEKEKIFVWKKGYFFEADIDFKESRKHNSHLGIAFNYEDSTRKADFVFIQYEKNNNRIVFAYGTYVKGKRTTKKKVHVSKSVRLDKYQKRYNQFKIRLTVNSDASRNASFAVNGQRIFRFETSMPTKSSVYLFTLGGRNYKKHIVKIFTSRICRRNVANEDAEEKHSRKKRWHPTNFRWYPNGGYITYAFTSYSTELGPELTRQEIEAALKEFSSLGFKFKEKEPAYAEFADIVFIFLRDGLHVDDKIFHGKQQEKAHAYVPVHGEIHFNDFEKFSVPLKEGEEVEDKVSLKFIAMHEIGHALGIGHSEMTDAVMSKIYPGDEAFKRQQLDDDDISALKAHYSDVVSPEVTLTEPLVEALPFALVSGTEKSANYEQRLPVPSGCLDRIQAALYLYDRKKGGTNDFIYLMSHGYVWAITVTNGKIIGMKDGYPKRIATVFNRAPGEIDAAFDTGSVIYLISGNNVYTYKVEDSIIAFAKETDLQKAFKLTLASGERIISAFNHVKVACMAPGDIHCIKTTLVVDESKYFEISWKKYGKNFVSAESKNSNDILGKKIMPSQFGAAFEYKNGTTNQIFAFQKVGRAASIFRDIYPESGVYVGENDGWIDVPPAFTIVGWCVKQTDTDEDTNYK